MPRDGSNIYHQPFPNVVTDTPIESAVYNGFTNDVASDLNLPRPISAGGTGASDAATAITNLGGEVAKQAVSNYNSFPFINGSFTSLAGATGAPTANACFGIYYENANGSYATLQARDQVTGLLYTKHKIANVWDANWSGETIGGNLQLKSASGGPGLFIDKPASGTASEIYGRLNATPRWLIRLGNEISETGSNAGSEFQIYSYTDAGTVLRSQLVLNRANGTMTNGGDINSQGNVYANGYMQAGSGGVGGIYYFGNSSGGAKTLKYDGTNFVFDGAQLVVNANFSTSGAVTVGGGLGIVGTSMTLASTGSVGTFFFGSSGTKYLQYDGTNFNLVGANLQLGSGLVANGNVYSGAGTSTVGVYYFGSNGTKYLQYDGTNFHATGGNFYVDSGAFVGLPTAGLQINSFSGSGSPWVANMVMANPNFNNMQMAAVHFTGVWAGIQIDVGGGSGPVFQFRADSSAQKTGGSTAWVVISDARSKDVQGDYQSGLAAITALKPVRFTYKGNVTDSPNESRPSDHVEYIGLVAQDAEQTMPEMFPQSKAYIDGEQVNDLRRADYSPLVFALVNAIKELTARVEALETR